MSPAITTNEPTIKCPKCGAAVPLTESLAAPMVAAVRAEMQGKVDEAREAKEEALAAVEQRTRDIDLIISTRVSDAQRRAQIDASSKAEAEWAGKLSAAEEASGTLRTKLAAAQQAQAEALRKERALEDRERELDLTIERRLANEAVTIRAAAANSAEEAWKFKVAEKDVLLGSMQTKIEELSQKITQGSQQLQGEVQELDLETTLRTRFHMDDLSEVGKGVNGADVTQAVAGGAGLILYESKRTKTYSSGWLPKLREDGRAAKADVLVLVTQAMPKDVENFDCVDGVWICAPKFALPLAAILRETLLRVQAERTAQDGLETKAAVVYKYMTGARFKQRVEAVVEAFTTMREDLDAERKAFARVWAKRETQLERALTNTAGLCGDLQGIAGGTAVLEIEGLSTLKLGGGE